METWFEKHGPGIIAGALSFFIVLIVGWLLVRLLVAGLSRLLRRRKVSALIERFLVVVTRRVLWVIVVVVALSELGLDVAPLIAGLGVGGFIIGFAFQETLGNLAAGLMLLINEPFKEGDWIEACATAGTVKDLNIMATTLSTGDNRVITIPNRKVWGDKIVNFNALPTRRVDMVFRISYRAELDAALTAIAEVIAAHPLVHQEPAAKIALSELVDSGVNIVVRPWCDSANYWTVKFELTRQIKEALEGAGVEIPLPQMDLNVRELPGAMKVA